MPAWFLHLEVVFSNRQMSQFVGQPVTSSPLPHFSLHTSHLTSQNQPASQEETSASQQETPGPKSTVPGPKSQVPCLRSQVPGPSSQVPSPWFSSSQVLSWPCTLSVTQWEDLDNVSLGSISCKQWLYIVWGVR